VLSQAGRAESHLDADYVIAATGYRAAVSRLTFIDETLQSLISKVDQAPILNRHFESSVSGLFFVGAAAANSFGPLLRFAYGAKFAALHFGTPALALEHNLSESLDITANR